MNQQVVRRYERLMLLYPKGYRDEWGPEMLATLVDTAESVRRRPVYREAASLVVGALRARCGAASIRSRREVWLAAARVAALLVLAHGAAQSAAHAGRLVFSELLMGRGPALTSEFGHPAALAAALLALVAVARRRYGLGVLLAGAAFVLAEWAMSWLPLPIRLVYGEFWQFPLAMSLMLPLLLLRHRPAGTARWPRWLLAVPLSLLLLPTAFDDSLGLQPYALLAVGTGCLVWSLVDARAAVAGAALLLGPALSLLGYYLPGWANGRSETLPLLAAYLAGGAILMAAGATLIPLRARL